MKTYILMLITRQQTAVKCQRINADGKGRQGGPERPGKNETEWRHRMRECTCTWVYVGTNWPALAGLTDVCDDDGVQTENSCSRLHLYPVTDNIFLRITIQVMLITRFTKTLHHSLTEDSHCKPLTYLTHSKYANHCKNVYDAFQNLTSNTLQRTLMKF